MRSERHRYRLVLSHTWGKQLSSTPITSQTVGSVLPSSTLFSFETVLGIVFINIY